MTESYADDFEREAACIDGLLRVAQIQLGLDFLALSVCEAGFDSDDVVEGVAGDFEDGEPVVGQEETVCGHRAAQEAAVASFGPAAQPCEQGHDGTGAAVALALFDRPAALVVLERAGRVLQLERAEVGALRAAEVRAVDHLLLREEVHVLQVHRVVGHLDARLLHLQLQRVVQTDLFAALVLHFADVEGQLFVEASPVLQHDVHEELRSAVDTGLADVAGGDLALRGYRRSHASQQQQQTAEDEHARMIVDLLVERDSASESTPQQQIV